MINCAIMLRTPSKLLILSCIAFLCVYAQDQGANLDALISQVFQPGAMGTNNPTPMPTSAPPPASSTSINLNPVNPNLEDRVDGCDCVPYYLCKNNTVIKDGFGLIDIRIKEGPCDNYFEICCGKDDRVEVPITTPPPVIPVPQGCGFRNPEGVGFRIKGDNDSEAQFGEFPWMVAILREEPVEGSTSKLNVYQCGGSLIHPKAVLTSAHCVLGRNLGKKYKIRAGEWDTQTKNEIFAHQDRDVETIVTHKDYRSGTLYNDIALLILKEPVDISQDNVGLVCLPPLQHISNDRECYASGWGKDVFGKEGKYQVILKKVELPIVDHARCQELLRTTRLGKHFELHSSFICAGGIPGRDTCKGDGGSPLVCPIPGHQGRYFQSGIVAWGIGCGEEVPGVYANVAGLRNWVDEQMAYQRLDQTYNY